MHDQYCVLLLRDLYRQSNWNSIVFPYILDDLGRAVEELVTVITEQESDTIDNGTSNPDVMLEKWN